MCQSYHPSIGLKKSKPLMVKAGINLLRKPTLSSASSNKTKCIARKAAKSKRSVRFASDHEVRIYARSGSLDNSSNNSSSNNDLYYSLSEINQFRLERKQTIKLLHYRYTTAQQHNVDVGQAAAFDGCILTGIENSLTPDVVAKTVRRRVAVVKAVLEEQTRQRQRMAMMAAMGGEKGEEEMENNVERLAYASRVQSKGAAKRARTIGFHQSRLGEV